MADPYLKRNVRLEPWTKSWAEKFEVEKERWRQMLGPVCLSVDHIGSTAVKAMMAKPIVDVMVVVTSLAELDAMMPEIQRLGYQAKGEHGVPGRRYFQRDEHGERAYHIHAYCQGNPGITGHLRFRDILRTDRSIAHAYERLKIELAARFPADKPAYTQGKNAFIKHVLE